MILQKGFYSQRKVEMAGARALFRFYVDTMNKHPWKTTIISTGVLVGAGDVIAQQAVEKKGKSHDIKRTGKMTLMGLCVLGPGLRTWYIILDRVVKGAGTSAALKKMLLDQTIWAPSFLAMFFCLVSAMNGRGIEEVKDKFRTDYIDAMKVNYMIWPAVQIVNFKFVPMQHRVIVVNIVALFWNTYLAYTSHKQ